VGGFTSIGAGNNYLADEFARVFLTTTTCAWTTSSASNFKIYYSWTDNKYKPGLQRPGTSVTIEPHSTTWPATCLLPAIS
jgi:hypothetical protein